MLGNEKGDKISVSSGFANSEKDIPKKVSQCLKMIRGRNFSLVRFSTKKFLSEAKTRTRDRWVLPKPHKVFIKRWYIQGELCGLTKKNYRNSVMNNSFGEFADAVSISLFISQISFLVKVVLGFGINFRSLDRSFSSPSSLASRSGHYGVLNLR